MGRKDFVSEEKIWTIPLYDNQSQDLPITSKQQALNLLKELIA